MEKRVRGRPRGGGSKLKRTETVTIRLDSKLRYLMEIAARKQRRTASSFIEWAIERALSAVELDEQAHVTVMHRAGSLWHTDEAYRLVFLAISYPDLLTYDEQLLWNVIRECLGLTLLSKPFDAVDFAILMGSMPTVCTHWKDFKKVAAGEADAASMSPIREEAYEELRRQMSQQSEAMQHSMIEPKKVVADEADVSTPLTREEACEELRHQMSQHFEAMRQAWLSREPSNLL